MPLDASAVAKLLHEFDQRTALRGGNPYRARAYSRAALGHLTGRQLLRRPGYEVDIDKVLEACARHGVAVEVNSNPLGVWIWTGAGISVRWSLGA